MPPIETKNPSETKSPAQPANPSVNASERDYGAGHKLVGKNYTTPDLIAKVTGTSKYAEDFRAEGMLFARLVLSPTPHARIRNIDASEALAMTPSVALASD